MGLQSKRSDGAGAAGYHTEAQAQAQAQIQRADLCLQRGELVAAEAILKALVKSTPEFLLAWSMLAWQYAARGLLDEALRCYSRAYVINPSNPKVLLALAKVQMRLGGNDAAIVTLKAALAAAPDDIEVQLYLAELQSDEAEMEVALAGYGRVLKADPENVTAFFGVAYCHEEMSDSAAALAAYEAVVRCSLGKPDKRKALATAASKLARLNTSIGDDQLLTYLQIDQPRDVKIRSLFAEAAIIGRQGRHEEAWSKLALANRMVLEDRGPEVRSEAEFRRKALEFCQAYRFEAVAPTAAMPGHASPIYILGPSRSGKSQLEAMLASEAGVARRFEDVAFERCLKQTAQLLGLPDGTQPWCIPHNAQQRLAEVYHPRMAALCPAPGYVTFSAPGNVSHVGRIASVDASARFLFLKRDKDDLAFSIFSHQYTTGNLYSYDVSSIQDYLNWYDRMTELWLARLPGRCHVVSYDELAAGNRLEVERVYQFLGLEPAGASAAVHDDRGCSAPYLAWLKQARG